MGEDALQHIADGAGDGLIAEIRQQRLRRIVERFGDGVIGKTSSADIPEAIRGERSSPARRPSANLHADVVGRSGPIV
jgi:hypothetical protein